MSAKATATTIYTVAAFLTRGCAPSQATVTVTVPGTIATGLPPNNPSDDLDRNWSYSRSFDGNGNVIGEGKRFSDGLGRSTQIQVKSQATGHVLATQTVYSSGGKPVLSTLAAPTNNQAFSYKDYFVTSNGANYQATNFEDGNANNPSRVDQFATPGSVGYYYSAQNTLEPLTATTSYPFSLTEEYGGPLGGVKRAAGPGDQFRMGLNKEAKGREFALLNELDHYLSLRPQFVPGSPAVTTLRLKAEKTVSVNVDGRESISFSDADGQLLATCLSGPQYAGLTLTAFINANPANSNASPAYQDLHVPAAGPVTLAVGGSGAIRIVDLLTETVTTYAAPWPTITLTPGFYRVVSEREGQVLSYPARYGDFSYSYYDDAGRVIATIAPRGVAPVSPSGDGATEPNLLKNPSFDQESWSTPTPSFWQTDGDAAAMYTGQYGGTHSGTHYATHYSSSPYAAVTHQLITNLPNGRYTLRAWAKSSGGQAKAYLLARNFGGSEITNYITPTPNGSSGNWALVELKNIPVSNGQCDIGFQSQASANQFIYFDDVTFFLQPEVATSTPQFVTRNTYSGAGTLSSAESPDEGKTDYLYARDGRIRFSQSALQRPKGRFSYSHYDEVGRVIESGEYTPLTAPPAGTSLANQLAALIGAPFQSDPYTACQALTNASLDGNCKAGFFNSVGNFIQFTVQVPQAGTYGLNIEYAAGHPNRTMSLLVNGGSPSVLVFALTDNEAWAVYSTKTVPVALQTGSNTIRFEVRTGDTGEVNYSLVQLTGPSSNSSASLATLLEERLLTNSLDPARCAQRNLVWYDLPWDGSLQSAGNDQLPGGRTQEFVLGAVAKTSNGTNTTWYSYDELGRVSWLVQKLPGVGTKTVDYAYDFTGNVLEVAYQKGQPDAFYHHYAYDADHRLSTVYTSSDGLTTSRTLQARYFYYLHGPLKRVEVADKLQGIDYTYTVQGWLKGINNAQKLLDPGKDSPNANGVLKDLFSLRLDYFNGDYASRQLTAPNLDSPANQNETRYDGTVRAATWQTAAAPTVHGYAYRYDAKGQLLQSDYGQLTGGTVLSNDPTKKFEEGNLSYDAHGNIRSLRRRDGLGVNGATDDFAYQYLDNTNKLLAVRNPAGTAVLSYEYDAIGQMTREAEAGKGDKFLQYDVTGKVTGVYRNADFTSPLARYAYDDRGFRSSKVVYNAQGGVQNTTYYVTDAQGNVLSTYEQPVGQALQRTEVPLYGSGRLGTLTRLDDGTLDARYELNDQLGNARVIFHKPTTVTYTATLEVAAVTQEEKDFTNVVNTRFAAPGRNGSARVARLGRSNGLYLGPSKTLTVQQGDTVTFTAYAWLTAAATATTSLQTTQTARSSPSLVVLAAPLTAPAGVSLPPGSESSPATSGKTLPRLRVGIGLILGGKRQAVASALSGTTQAGTGTSGNAQLHYLVKDKDGKVVLDQYQNANPGTPGTWQQLQVGLRLAQGGTVELSVETDGASGPDVYFDDVEVKHTGGTIVQEQHTYAFGSPLTGLNYVVGTKRYRHGYQGQFAERDEETGYESFELRLYNARIGRWMAPDPEGQFDSPYVGMGNNPVSGTDPDGGFTGDPVALGGVLVLGQRATGAWAQIGLQTLAAINYYGNYSRGVWNGIGSNVLPEPIYGYQPQMNGAFGNGQLVGHGISAVGGSILSVGGGILTLLGVGATVGTGGLAAEVSIPITLAGAATMGVGASITNGAIGRAKLNMSGRSKPDLPSLDNTGKVHGKLPNRKDLSKYSPDELRQLQKELTQSIKQRIRKNSQLGSDRAHGQRQAAEQQLLRDIDTHLGGK